MAALDPESLYMSVFVQKPSSDQISQVNFVFEAQRGGRCGRPRLLVLLLVLHANLETGPVRSDAILLGGHESPRTGNQEQPQVPRPDSGNSCTCRKLIFHRLLGSFCPRDSYWHRCVYIHAYLNKYEYIYIYIYFCEDF